MSHGSTGIDGGDEGYGLPPPIVVILRGRAQVYIRVSIGDSQLLFCAHGMGAARRRSSWRIAGPD